MAKIHGRRLTQNAQGLDASHCRWRQSAYSSDVDDWLVVISGTIADHVQQRQWRGCDETDCRTYARRCEFGVDTRADCFSGHILVLAWPQAAGFCCRLQMTWTQPLQVRSQRNRVLSQPCLVTAIPGHNHAACMQDDGVHPAGCARMLVCGDRRDGELAQSNVGANTRHLAFALTGAGIVNCQLAMLLMPCSGPDVLTTYNRDSGKSDVGRLKCSGRESCREPYSNAQQTHIYRFTEKDDSRWT